MTRPPSWRVLLVEDDENVRVAVSVELRGQGLVVETATDLVSADAVLRTGPYHCVVFDRMLPDGDSVAYVFDRRRTGWTVPVLFLTARDSLADRVTGFEHGGDDYLVKRDRDFGSAESAGREMLDELCVVEQQGSPADAVLSTTAVARSASDVVVLVTAASADPQAWRALALRCPATVCVLLGDEAGTAVSPGLTVLRGPGAPEAVEQWNRFVG
jgi:CheY-like chemotaxis protein